MDDVHALTAAYALHALDPAEEREFEEHLRGCEQCRTELAELRESAAALAYAADGPAPPPALRERVLEAARTDNVVALPRRRMAAYVAGAAAAAAIAVAAPLGLWADSLSEELDRERAASAILADPEARSVALAGANGRLVVSATREAALVVSGLERAPEGKDYEIWVVQGDRALPSGLFDGEDGRDVVRLERLVPAGATVAVTLEREGGVDSPTGAPLFSAIVS